MNDYPDYFGISIFPKYGDCVWVVDEVDVPLTVYTEILKIEGKGRTYGGIISVADTDANILDAFKIFVDGDFLYGSRWLELYERNIVGDYKVPITISSYDTETPLFTAIISPDITFESSLLLEYYAAVAAPVTVEAGLFYTEIVS